ncbi:flagellar motor protein MotB [Paenibacillus chartarius]|uniref:Flagellar motor protein MotB n=1 Tax=Paenibacillus chartarius TaxID=747481 RepID=A0ABV6DVF3_9BACL
MAKHKKEHHEEHVDESWLIPYADLLTLLLALFIILFASSQVDSKKYDSLMQALNSAFTGGLSQFEVSNVVPLDVNPNTEKQKSSEKEDSTSQGKPSVSQLQEQLKKEEKDLEELQQKLNQYIADNQLSAQLETKLTNDRLMITIRDRALFDSGSAALKAESQQLAATIAGMLAQYPGYEIEVAGHTDNIPIHNAEFESNWDLSAKRALNFMKILLGTSALDPSLFSSIGYGEYRPVAGNENADGRSKNRRVEVSIIRNVKIADVAEKSQ